MRGLNHISRDTKRNDDARILVTRIIAGRLVCLLFFPAWKSFVKRDDVRDSRGDSAIRTARDRSQSGRLARPTRANLRPRSTSADSLNYASISAAMAVALLFLSRDRTTKSSRWYIC